MGGRLLWLWRVVPEIPARELFGILAVWWSHLSTNVIKLYTITSTHRHKWIHVKLVRSEEDQGLYLLISWLWYCIIVMQDVTIGWNYLKGIWSLCIIFRTVCESTMNSTIKWLIASGQTVLGAVLKGAINCESWRGCQGKRLRCLIQSEGII